MIGLELPENFVQLRSAVKNVAENVMRPIAGKYDEAEHEYPVELEFFRSMAGMVSMGGGKNKEKDGEDKKEKDGTLDKVGSNLTTVLVTEEICWGDMGLLLTIPGMGLGNAAIAAVATPEQLERFGKKWAGMAITEPASGSDSGSIQTTAELDGDEWILNGEKIFVTAASRADVIVVWANIDLSAGKAGIRSFIVPTDTPGFKVEKIEKKMGLRASDTCVVHLNNCRIPKNNLLGSAEIKKTKGFKGVMKTFDNTRPVATAMAVGGARATLELLQQEMAENNIPLDYGKSPNSLSYREYECYRMEADIEASRLLAWRAAWMADNGVFNSTEASMSKAKGGTMVTTVCRRVCRLLGPTGYSRKKLAEKWTRDAKIIDIFEGTGQIQRLIVARGILGLSSKQLK